MQNKKLQVLLISITILLAAVLVFFLSPNSARAPQSQNTSPTLSSLSPTTSLFFAGDIMLSRNVAGKIYQSDNIYLPYANVKDRISTSDIAFANLESPFNDTGRHDAQDTLIFNADLNFIPGLLDAGFDILSTANNHAFDQSRRGIEKTLSGLSGIAIGTGLDCHSGKILEKNNIKFGFLAYSYAAHNDGGKIPDPLVCDWNDEEQIITDIQSMRAKVDFLIISAHMGTEYKRTPDPENAARARKTIDAGTDVFIGHHPHWIQTIEQYNGKWIFYSLGNFVFDQMWSQDTREGLAVQISTHEKQIKTIELLPAIIENYCCPRWASEQESLAILHKLGLTTRFILGENN